MADMVLDQHDIIRLNVSDQCNVTMTRTDFNHYLIDNPSCCLHGGMNSCCDKVLSTMRIDDHEGIPVCGRYIYSQTTIHGAGLGHWLVEYNRNIGTSIMFNMEIVKFSYMVGPRGTDKTPGHDASIIFGFDNGLHYNFSQLEQAVMKGYIKQYVLKDTEHHKFYDFIQQDKSNNAWYVVPKPKPNPNFTISRCYIRGRVYSSSVSHPLWHRMPFRSDKVNVVMHIRRGDVVSSRFMNNSYFIEVGKHVVHALNGSCDIHILSEGSISAFDDVNNALPSAHIHLNGKSWTAFLMMYYADVLVTSVSAYSHVAAELGNSVVLAGPLWYPLSETHRVVKTNNGAFDMHEFRTKLSYIKKNKPCFA